MTTDFIWDYKLPSQKYFTKEEFEDIMFSIERVINQNDGKYIYTHKVFFFLS